MDEILNNSWIVGIGGGILSGLVVTAITRYLFSKRDNREYLQKVDAVNREVIYALRPGISEGHIPTDDVLRSVINATARKYKVNRSDVFRSDQIAEELIKEIMDSSFISSETKTSYCETLAHLVKPKASADAEGDIKVEQIAAEHDYRSRIVLRMSAILGLTAAFVTMFTFLARNIDIGVKLADTERAQRVKEVIEFMLPTLGVLAATLTATLTMLVFLKLRGVNDSTANRAIPLRRDIVDKDKAGKVEV
jgi:hypothetical protein